MNSEIASYMPMAIAYVKRVRETFQDDTERFQQFLDALLDFRTHRIDLLDVIARVAEILKGHRDLIVRFNAFLPKKLEIPLENENSPKDESMGDMKPPKRQTMGDMKPPKRETMEDIKPPKREPVEDIKPPKREPMEDIKPPKREPVEDIKPPKREPVEDEKPPKK